MDATKIPAGLLLALAFAPAVAHAGTVTVAAKADAYVASDLPTTNYGTATRLSVDGSPQQAMLLRFAVAGVSGTVSSAKLRLYANNPTTDGPRVFRASGAWSESAVTWNTRPSAAGSALDKLGTVNTATWYELDVTSAVTANGTYDFIVTGSVADGSTYHSRETSQKPELVITSSASDPTPPPPPPPSMGAVVPVTLQPRAGYTGTQRVNFAVPLPRGQLFDPDLVRVLKGGMELAAGRRELALYEDGSVRSVQIQVQTSVAAGTQLEVRIGETPTVAPLALVAVSTTLEPADGTQGPKVWARMPASWLAASGVAGPLVTEALVEGTALDAFDGACDYGNHTVTEFLSLQSSRDVWLYDRGTTMYRGYARRGDQTTLESAYRETAIYRAGITGTDAATRIGVPTAADDLKYHYTQNLAIHYLLTGDDRFRESAEDVATRVAALWSSPGYAGGSDFWTERNAGFALLAYVWARIVTDNEAAILEQRADAAVAAYLAMQAAYPTSWTDANARCFAHTAEAHGEDWGTWGCSPWMSAILAEGLDVYASEGGTSAAGARQAIVKLGRILARDGRDSSGKPFYWMGIGGIADEVDPDDEHWGEPAYVVALAWHHTNRTDATLKTAAQALLAGLKSHGSSPHMRSFNWQCRTAVATPYYLR